MNESSNRSSELENISNASNADLKALVERLVETGRVSVDVINDELESIREAVQAAAAQAVLEDESLEPEMVFGIEKTLFLMAGRRCVLAAKLERRFKINMKRHKSIRWEDVKKKIFEASPEKLRSLHEMERNGHEPDVVGYDADRGEYLFCSCSLESPAKHRNIVYDKAAEEWLMANKPDEKCDGNAVDIAAAMGIEMLDENQYRNNLQHERLGLFSLLNLSGKGKYDVSTSSWLKTPIEVREKGDACRGHFATGYHAGVGVYTPEAITHEDFVGFRGVLRI